MNEIALKIEGPTPGEGIPLHLVLNSLENFQAILDKTYLVASGKQKVTGKDRDKVYYLNVKDFRKGSLEFRFEIVLKGMQTAMSMLPGFGPDNLWQFTKQAFDFLKLVFTAAGNGIKPKYQFKINPGGDFRVHIGDTNYEFKGPVFVIGERSLPYLQNLAHVLKDGRIAKILTGEINKEEFVLTSDNHDLFDVKKKPPIDEVKLECEIFRFNKFTDTGNLKVNKKDQVIPEGKHSFILTDPLKADDFVRAMLKDKVTLTAQIEWRINPLSKDEKDEVEKVHVIDIIS